MKKKIIAFGSLVLIGIAAKSNCIAAEMLQKTNFSDGVNLPWNVYEQQGKYSSSAVLGGEYKVHLEYPGTNIWDVSVRHSEISIKKDHKYTVKFSLKATKSCKVYAKIGDIGDPFYEAWNNNWSEFDVKANEILEVTDTFTAEKDSANADFAFMIGGKYASQVPYDISFISMSLDDPDFVPTPIATPMQYDIRVNQLGYYTYGEKRAILNCAKSQSDTDKCVIKDKDGKIVFEPSVTPFGKDSSSGENINSIDFSLFMTPGKGYTICYGDSKSLPFDIGSDIYSSMKYDALKYFYHSRSGIDIKVPYCIETKWERPEDKWDYTSSLKEDTGYKGPASIYSRGGWYEDDYDKYMVNGGLALWLLQNEYEFVLASGNVYGFEDNKLNIPESGNKFHDLLDEARWEMEWMLKMQIPKGYDKEGMAAHKIVDGYYYPPSTAATLNLAACGAQAARLWKDIDPEFSAKCLAAAETAWNAALENPAVLVSYKEDSAGRIYGDDYVEDEFYWAGCELYLTTRSSKYLERIKESECFCKMPTVLKGANEGIPGAFDWSSTSALGTLSLSLFSSDFPKAAKNIVDAAVVFNRNIRNEGYRVTLPVTTFTARFDGIEQIVENGYPEFSNQLILNNSIIFAYAYDLKKRAGLWAEGDIKYTLGNSNYYIFNLRYSLDYIFGLNPNNKCYVTGYGSNPVRNLYQNYCSKPFYGLFPNGQKGFAVSGPSTSNIDPWFYAGASQKSVPPMKDYDDSIYRSSSNRVSTSLNAALAWVTEYSEKECNVPCIYIHMPSPVTPTTSVTPTTHKEDINKDGCVNMVDAMAIARVFGTVKPDSSFDSKCDLNNDDCVNMADVVYIAKCFGNEYKL